jgi:hypothetical protein
MSRIPKVALNLKQFMLRQEVLKLPDVSSRKELQVWVREDFKKNKNQVEEIQIKMSMQAGLRSLKELQQSLELSGISCESDDKKF